MSTIQGVSTTAYGGYQASPSTAGTLGKQDFLNLLAAQLRQQNPLDPVDNAEFMAQTAQFNALEQMQELNQTLSAFASLSALSQASGLIGRHVTAVDASNTRIEGVVSEVALSGNQPLLLVDGVAVSLDQIVIVKEPYDV